MCAYLVVRMGAWVYSRHGVWLYLVGIAAHSVTTIVRVATGRIVQKYIFSAFLNGVLVPPTSPIVSKSGSPASNPTNVLPCPNSTQVCPGKGGKPAHTLYIFFTLQCGFQQMFWTAEQIFTTRRRVSVGRGLHQSTLSVARHAQNTTESNLRCTSAR